MKVFILQDPTHKTGLGTSGGRTVSSTEKASREPISRGSYNISSPRDF